MKGCIHCILYAQVLGWRIIAAINIMVFLSTPLISDTTVGVMKAVHQKHLEGLIENTTGTATQLIHSGVLTETARGMPSKSHVPVIHSKTHAKTMGQIPYAGKMY